MKVLFAVNDSTRGRFLPGYDAKKLPPFEEHWLDFTGLDAAGWEKTLRTLQPEVLVTCWETPAFPPALVDDPTLSVRYICHLTGGVRGVAPRGLIERGVIVTNWGNRISHTIAEHAMLLTLGALRSMPLWRPFMADPHGPAKGAKRDIPTRSLRGRKVGIHGFGAIVKHLVSLLKPFGVEIASYSVGVPPEFFAQHGVRRCETLEELAAGSEIFIELEALTPQSRGTVTRQILELLPTNAVFVNVGRGAVVDEAALGELATAGKILVAADVFTVEPLSIESPLMKVPTALLSPHIAGPTQDALPLCGEHAMTNLARYLGGKRDEMESIVTLEMYDRQT